MDSKNTLVEMYRQRLVIAYDQCNAYRTLTADQSKDELTTARTTIVDLQSQQTTNELVIQQLKDEMKHLQMQLTIVNQQLPSPCTPIFLQNHLQYLEVHRCTLNDTINQLNYEKQHLVETIKNFQIPIPASNDTTNHTGMSDTERTMYQQKIHALEQALQTQSVNTQSQIKIDEYEIELTQLRTTMEELKSIHNLTIRDMTETHQSHIDALNITSNTRIDTLKHESHTKMEALKIDHTTQLEALKRDHTSQLETLKTDHTTIIDTLNKSIINTQTELTTLRTQYDELKQTSTAQHESDTSTIERLTSMIKTNAGTRKSILNGMKVHTSGIRTSFNEIKHELSESENFIQNGEPAIMRAMADFILSRRAESQHLVDALKIEMAVRKQLFNTIQELKGNIRVFCRIRPGDDNVISYPSDNTLSVNNIDKKSVHTFEFEKIFEPTSTQEQVFSEVSELIISVLDGYNVCIFAYGQTGSGKTFTMEGPSDNPGVNNRALSKLFSTAQERFPDIQYEFKISLLEIYNEQINDLLGEQNQQLKIIATKTGMEVEGLSMVAVTRQEQVLNVLKKGTKARRVTSTEMNDVSSRSHLILSVYVTANNRVSGKSYLGKLHLIDLAGSERVGRSGVTGAALKEAQNINSSLSALGNVIAARANKQNHVPYRDSTLTYLLQDSLEKNAKALMFVQISPATGDVGESLCSLRFAERVKKVELGSAKTNAASPVAVGVAKKK